MYLPTYLITYLLIYLLNYLLKIPVLLRVISRFLVEECVVLSVASDSSQCRLKVLISFHFHSPLLK